MRNKILKYSLIFLITFCIIYTIGWFFTLMSISKEINNKNKSAQINLINDHYIKFSKVLPAIKGFPFKFAVKLKDVVETTDTIVLQCSSPVIAGYDLLKQSFFISYSGEAELRYKPVQSGFGAKIKVQDNSLSIKLPLSFSLFKVLLTKKNLFETINFVKNIELNFKKVSANDLVDNDLLYSQDSIILDISFNNRKYYSNFDDFQNNIPDRFDIYYFEKINNASLNKTPLPKNFLLLGFVSPFKYFTELKLYIKPNEPALYNISKNLEVGITDWRLSNEACDFNANIFYNGTITDQRTNFDFNVNSKVELKENFIESYLKALRYFLSYTKTYSYFIRENIEYLSNNKDKLKLLKAIEGKSFDSNFEINVNQAKEKLELMIKNFNLSSGITGIYLKNKTSFTNYFKIESSGDLLINNYVKLLDIIGNDFYRTGKYNSISDETRGIYLETNKKFLKSISDHPNSKSDALSFEYDINSRAFLKSKIGSTELGKIALLYYLELYKNVASYLKPGENLYDKIKELIPSFDHNEEILKTLSDLKGVSK